jgi:hypothetical protein
VLSTIATGDLLYNKGSEDLANPLNSAGAVIAFAKSENGTELAAIIAVADLIGASEEYAEAKIKLVPLLDELAIAEAAEEAEAAATNEARCKLEEAKAKAVADAVAKVEQKFATA